MAVKSADDMDDEIFIKHLEARHGRLHNHTLRLAEIGTGAGRSKWTEVVRGARTLHRSEHRIAARHELPSDHNWTEHEHVGADDG